MRTAYTPPPIDGTERNSENLQRRGPRTCRGGHADDGADVLREAPLDDGVDIEPLTDHFRRSNAENQIAAVLRIGETKMPVTALSAAESVTQTRL